MNQFLMVNMALLQDRKNGKNKINNNEILALSLLMQRMNLSLTKGALFYDSSAHEHYTIYQLKDMAYILELSERTVSDIYNHLEELGLIRRVKQFNMPDKIFIPAFTAHTMKPRKEKAKKPDNSNVSSVDAKIAGTYMQKLQPSYINNNYINNTSNTVNTEKRDEKTEIEKLRTAIIGKSRMHPNAVDAVLRYVNYDYAKADNLIGVIYRAKRNIAYGNGLLNAKVTRFENNEHMNVNLAPRLNHIFEYLDTKDNKDGYLMSSLQNYFMHEFGLIDDEKVTPAPQRTTQGHKSANFECLNEDASKTAAPKIIDALMMKEQLKWFNSDNRPNEVQQSEIKERIKELLTENGIDPNSTTQLPKNSNIIKAIDADIATV